jgi:hypothetical protein
METEIGAARPPLFGWWQVAVLGALLAAGWGVFFLGAGMQQVLAWLALQSALPFLAVLAGLVVGLRAVWRLARRRGSASPERTGARWARRGVAVATWLLAIYPLAWSLGIGVLRFPVPLADTTPNASVRLPTDAPMRVMWGGDELHGNRHASFPDQRWAYDLAVEPVLVGSSRLDDYGCWSVPVVAPAAGRVVAAHDGEPDEIPGKPSGNLTAVMGNHVAIELPEGGFLFVAHLQKGSVAVAEGSHVAEGALLGRCGNSGNTSEPHVHMHLQRQSPRSAKGGHRPVNFSEGLPLSFRDHDGAPMPLGGIEVAGGKPRAVGAVVRHVGAGGSSAPGAEAAAHAAGAAGGSTPLAAPPSLAR